MFTVFLYKTLAFFYNSCKIQISREQHAPRHRMVGIAQLVESRIVIPVVVGSSPISHPRTKLVQLNAVRAFSWFISEVRGTQP